MIIDEHEQKGWVEATAFPPEKLHPAMKIGFEFLVLDEKRARTPDNLALVWKGDEFKLMDALAGVVPDGASVSQIPVTAKDADPFTEPRKFKSKACYVLRAQGLKWSEVAEKAGCKINNVVSMAQSYARSRDLPWPPKVK